MSLRDALPQSRRQSVEFTDYDGYVPEAGPALDPCAHDVALSVTELEKAAECPFRFFLKRGLGLRSVDERERDKDLWLDPLTRGAELHDLYAALLRRSRHENRRPNESDAVWLKELAQDRLKELNEEMPASAKEIFDRESKDFLADVKLFLEAESAESNSTPIAFEVSFGRPLDDDDNEPLARSEPVEIDLGQGIKFRIAGRIDRIDKVGPASFEVLDYKTGGFWREKWQGSFDGGRRLQHALVRTCRSRTSQGPLSESGDHRWRVLLLEPQGTSGASGDPSSYTEGYRGCPGRLARCDHQWAVYPDSG